MCFDYFYHHQSLPPDLQQGGHTYELTATWNVMEKGSGHRAPDLSWRVTSNELIFTIVFTLT